MPECEIMAECAFLRERTETLPFAAHAIRARYCTANHEHCARYMVCRVLGADRVPPLLYPGDTEDAWKMILGEEG